MLSLLVPPSVNRVVVYLEPINVRWGPDKLRSFCLEAMGLEPDTATSFVFTNKRRDTLVSYFVDATGDQTLMKKLDKGAFLVPAREPDGKPFVVLKPSMLARLFRT